VAGECEGRGAKRTPRPGGPSRKVPTPQVGVTGALGGGAVTPGQRRRRCRGSSAVGRPRQARNSGRGSENSAHRGSCGASLKRRARDVGEKTDLRFQHYRTAASVETAVLLRCREASKPVGRSDPWRPARPRTCSRAHRPKQLGPKQAARAMEFAQDNAVRLDRPRCPCR
jgi:hypothetical protein